MRLFIDTEIIRAGAGSKSTSDRGNRKEARSFAPASMFMNGFQHSVAQHKASNQGAPSDIVLNGHGLKDPAGTLSSIDKHSILVMERM